MKQCLLLLLACGVQAHALDLEWVSVGDPGNQPDKTGYGAVAYEFQISKYEITSEQYAEFLNALAVKSDPHGLWRGSTIQRLGKPGEYRYQVIKGQERWPVVNISFLEAMRFVNWLHNGQSQGDTEKGAYDIPTHGGLARHEVGAKVWIATEDEWYKAAYFQPESKGGPAGGYWLYPTRSNEQPVLREAGAKEANSANYLQDSRTNSFGGVARSFADSQPVGSYPNSASYYGTHDQGGNAWEWNEAVVFDAQRCIRGGCMAHSFEKMRSVVRTSANPAKRYPDTGFRLACAMPKAADAGSIKTTTPKQP
jgi:formylglycine-generating enzyme